VVLTGMGRFLLRVIHCLASFGGCRLSSHLGRLRRTGAPHSGVDRSKNPGLGSLTVGRSAEIVALLGLLARQAAAGSPPAGLIAITNDTQSPLAEATSLMAETGRQHTGQLSGVLLPLHTEPELAVSTRTYLNTLAIAQLAAHTLCSYAAHGKRKTATSL